MLILGLDPGLGTTGWGLIRAEGNRLSHVANGKLKTDTAAPLPRRLAHLDAMLSALIIDHAPAGCAVEDYEAATGRTLTPEQMTVISSAARRQPDEPECEHEWVIDMIQMPQGYSKPGEG